MKNILLEKRIARLEKMINESLKDDAISELKDELSYWLDTYGSRKLLSLRDEILDYRKKRHFVNLVEDIELNDSDAATYYYSFCEDDNLYECDEFDNDVVDIIDELIK